MSEHAGQKESEEHRPSEGGGVGGGGARPKGRRRKRAVLALVLGLVLAAVVLEVAAQGYFIVMNRTGWHHIKTHKFHFFEKADSDILGYRMRSGWDKSFRGRWLRVNKHGIRDREDEVPQNVMRVALLGDSVVFGNNLAQERTLSELVQARLDPSGMNARVLNFGVSGYCLEQVLEFLRQKNEIYDVDVVVLVLNPNDFCRLGTVTEGGSNGLYRMYNPPLIKGPWVVRKLVYRLIRGSKARPSARWYRWVYERNGGDWKELVVELAAYVEARGAELIVVPFPRSRSTSGWTSATSPRAVSRVSSGVKPSRSSPSPAARASPGGPASVAHSTNRAKQNRHSFTIKKTPPLKPSESRP